MEYRVIRTGQSDDHIEHALFGGGRQKGAQNKDHKYLARAWWQNKWRYAYTQAEVRALQMLGKNQSLSEKQKIKKLERESAAAKKTTDKIENQAKRSVTRAVDDARSEVASRANIAKVTASRAVDSARNAVSNAASKASKSAKEIVSDVKSGVKAKQVAIKAETAKNDAKNAVSRASEAVKSTASKASKSASEATEKGKAKAFQVLNSLKSKGTETISSAKSSIDKGKSKVNEIFNKVSSTAKSTVSKATETVKDTVEKAGNAAKETASKASSASEKGKAAAEKLLNKVSSATKSAGEKATDTASKVYGNVKTQIDLAENAINESRFDRYGENRIKNAQKKIDSIDKELAEYEKEAAKDSRFKEQNQGWLSIKQRERAEAVKELSEAKKWQKDWEDSDKTLYRSTDEVSDMNPNMRKSEPVTSSQRKEEIKEQNLYKYNSDYRKASDRASEIGSYLDNWDARGGPQTAEGKASYNKMMRELKQLESELEKMRK